MLARCATRTKTLKHQWVDDILTATDYYQVLSVTPSCSKEDIRKAYIKKSRVCHPDRFVPAYPRATESFQLLALAYETLSNPSSKLLYDLSIAAPLKERDYSTEANAVDIFERVIEQLYLEILDGEFQCLRTLIHILNSSVKRVHITDSMIEHLEATFLIMRGAVLSTRKYMRIIQFEVLRLYEIQQEIRSLPFTDIWGRIQRSMTLCKVLLQLPLLIQTTSQKSDYGTVCQGVLGPHMEGTLRVMIDLLELGEELCT
ncbi:uncharacterized protein BYT42DRAFT_580810 [Radiomyces spectabilis]|uniref:uncharacterized protein n=1 Tax=Radiomyces spectabilis TaxID=64574 RepID=UPI00221EAA23|nr:uncharacterized protein BYT42DRAFT_580810 [Radiomyces spectabilis]KAI8371596.1 hypothetical protein BYT42DRAFT_580810 [Radiomyces spectabilis]